MFHIFTSLYSVLHSVHFMARLKYSKTQKSNLAPYIIHKASETSLSYSPTYIYQNPKKTSNILSLCSLISTSTPITTNTLSKFTSYHCFFLRLGFYKTQGLRWIRRENRLEDLPFSQKRWFIYKLVCILCLMKVWCVT